LTTNLSIVVTIQCLLPPGTPRVCRLHIDSCINECLIEIQHLTAASVLDPVWQALSIRGPALHETSQVSLQDDCQGIILHGRNRAIIVGVWYVLGMVSRWHGEEVVVGCVLICVTKPIRIAGKGEITDCKIKTLKRSCVRLRSIIDGREERLSEVGKGRGRYFREVEVHVSGEIV
jgi:hypothetical protein